MNGRNEALDSFTVAAVEWAAGGRGQLVVDAAAQALANGVDSPTLRILAGAPRARAEEEASELAPAAFDELGLVVAPRLSPEAIVDGARQRAAHFLQGHGGSARDLARDLWRMCVAAGYPAELHDFSGLDDYYDLIEHNLIDGRTEDVDAATIAAARALVRSGPGESR